MVVMDAYLIFVLPFPHLTIDSSSRRLTPLKPQVLPLRVKLSLGIELLCGFGRINLAMGSLKKRRKAKINKHKRRKKLRAHRHKKRTWQK